MKKDKMMKKLIALYERTLKNCRFYEAEGKEWALMNEIGCLRGILYAIEEIEPCFTFTEAIPFIEKQQEFRTNDDKEV